jgi:hypothetical protein
MSALSRAARTIRRLHPAVVALSAALVVIGGAELLGRWQDGGQHATAPGTVPTTAGLAAESIGNVDLPQAATLVADSIKLSGWALDAKGVRGVEIRVDGRSFPAKYGITRPDVAAAHPGYPNSNAAGFEFEISLGEHALDRKQIDVVVISQAGGVQLLARRSVIPPGALSLWPTVLAETPVARPRPFHFLMATSNAAGGGATGVETEYRQYESASQRVGLAVPILYLRTTRGAAGDFEFDPDFDLSRKCNGRVMVEDNLSSVIRHAVERKIPVQFILNGGIWSDANCESIAWDISDNLERDDANCQWSQDNQVFPDDYLKGLNGSVESPELARSLTYNIYAATVRQYKKRNLQSAAAIIARFAKEHPELFVGVTLDSDTYMNPFFAGKEVFDYNPGMLRQFREWLRGAGPYAGKPTDGAPDLRRYRRTLALSLAEANRLARASWGRWEDVDPPRRFPGSAREPQIQPGQIAIWDDPWWHLWDEFRKHVVGLHYDELSSWVSDMGVPRERIFSAQGFLAPGPGLAPFAIRLTSHGQNYDSAGVSVEGSIPRDGHLGAILYGESAVNDVRMEGPHSMFATFARMDPGWAVVEFNNADLKNPQAPTTYAQGYRAFRDLFNFDAVQISAMAWNGSNGIFAGQPGYLSYTSWRNTLAEQAMRDHMVSHAGLPLGSRLWTFGTPRHADGDGWTATGGAIRLGNGFLEVRPAGGLAVLLSPADQVIRPGVVRTIAVVYRAPRAITSIGIEAMVQGGAIHPATSALRSRTLPDGTHIATLPIRWPASVARGSRIFDRMSLTIRFDETMQTAQIERIALF